MRSRCRHRTAVAATTAATNEVATFNRKLTQETTNILPPLESTVATEHSNVNAARADVSTKNGLAASADSAASTACSMFSVHFPPPPSRMRH